LACHVVPSQAAACGGKHSPPLPLLLSLPCCCCCCSYDLEALSDDEGAAARGHITNYAQNVNGTVWSLDMLKEHLGEQAPPHCAVEED
jgi:hypothetical protein